MVFSFVVKLLESQFACDPEDVSMTTALDRLNLSEDDRSELAFLLEEEYGVTIPTEELEAFETVEDLVAYVEDGLSE